MAEKIIKRRYTDLSYYSPLEINALSEKRAELKSRFGAYITQAATLSNLPEFVIESVILIENGQFLNPSLVNSSGAVGLMQIKAATVTDVLIREKKTRLTGTERNVLRRLGVEVTRLDGAAPKLKKGKAQKWYSSAEGFLVSTEQLKNPELNILLGTIYLSQLIDEFTEVSGLVRMDKVIVKYNQGYFYKAPLGPTTAIFLRNLKSTEAKAYVLKIGGKNGLLEALA